MSNGEGLDAAPATPVTVEKLIIAYAVIASRDDTDPVEMDRTSWLILRAWRSIEATPVRPMAPRLRLVLDEPDFDRLPAVEGPDPEPVKAPKVPSDADLIERFAQHQRRANLSPRTIDVQASALRAAAKALPHGFATATASDVETMLDNRRNRHGEPIEARRRYWTLSCLHTFYAWAIGEGYLEQDPTAKIRRPKLTKTLPRPMSDADLRRAIEAAEPMMRCWLLLGAMAGLRCQEIAGLTREDVDETDMMLRVVFGKGRKPRDVPMHPDVLAALQALPMPASGFLFRRKRLLTRYPPAQLAQALNLYLHGIGIKSGAHTLRHAFATRIYNETLDLRLTQELLGHSDPATTAIYTQHDAGKARGAVAALRIGKASDDTARA